MLRHGPWPLGEAHQQVADEDQRKTAAHRAPGGAGRRSFRVPGCGENRREPTAKAQRRQGQNIDFWACLGVPFAPSRLCGGFSLSARPSSAAAIAGRVRRCLPCRPCPACAARRPAPARWPHDRIVGGLVAAVAVAQEVEHHRARPDHGDRVGDALAGDVRRRTMHRLEQRREGAIRIEVGRRAMPMVPVHAGPRSERMSPNRLEATTTSKRPG